MQAVVIISVADRHASDRLPESGQHAIDDGGLPAPRIPEDHDHRCPVLLPAGEQVSDGGDLPVSTYDRAVTAQMLERTRLDPPDDCRRIRLLSVFSCPAHSCRRISGLYDDLWRRARKWLELPESAVRRSNLRFGE